MAGRRKDLGAITLDPVTGDNVTGYEKELDAFPDAMKQRFGELSLDLSEAAKRQLGLQYNDASPQWAQEAVQILDGMERQDAVAETTELARAGRAADALQILEIRRETLGPELHQKLTSQVLLLGAMADLQQVAAIDGWDAAASELQNPDWQRRYHLDLSQADTVREKLAGFVNQSRAQAKDELENEREKSRDVLNDQLAERKLTYELIDLSNLDESEQQQYVAWMRQDADRRLTGQKIVTDEWIRHDLKARALDIARGRAEYRDVLNSATEAKAAGKLDDDAYRDVLAAARTELSGMHAEILRSTSRSAERQLVTVSESAIERYAELMSRGTPGAKDILARAENQRQLEYRLVDLHDSQIRAFLQANPEATTDDLERQSRKILLGLRKSDAAQRARTLDAWDVETMTAPAPSQAGTIEVYDSKTRQRIVDGKPAGPPVGLESIWDSITEEERATVLQLLRQGFLPDDILNHFQQQPATQ